jgi:uncharacterized protein YndB with AHSA1/START domain
MTARTDTATGASRPELVLTRVFDAPRDVVFNAWTDPRHVVRWWGPHGFTNPVCEVDARPGGAIRIHMRGPDGTVYPMRGEFREIVPPERLVLTTAVDEPDGSPRFEVLHTVTFTEQDGKTVLTLTTRIIKETAAAAPQLGEMHAGWTQSLERLSAYLTKS